MPIENGQIDKAVMDDRRKAILKFWKDVEVRSPRYSDYLKQEAINQAKDHLSEKAEAALENGVYKWAKTTVRQLVEKLSACFEGLSIGNSQFIEDLVDTFYEVVVDNILSIAKPVKNILKGLMAVTEKFITKISIWRKSALVRIGEGHPRVLCDAISAAFNKSIMAEMGSLAYNAVKVAGVITSCGVSEIVTNVVDAIKALGTFVWRCLERRWIQNFIKECGYHYKKGLLYKDKERFARFLRKTTSYVPYVAAVTMHTGDSVVGSMGHFFLFATPDGKKINQKEFGATVSFMLQQRAIARNLIQESKLRLRSERSEVQGVIEYFVNEDAYYMKDDNYKIEGYSGKKKRWFS